MMRRLLILGAVLAVLAGPPLAAAEAPPGSTLAVVFVGGLGSSGPDAAATFAPLATALVGGGISQDRLLTFSYDPTSAAYAPAETCQPLATSTQLLAAYLRGLRDSHQADSVVLVGHSMGGVIALDATSALRQDDASQPFVRKLVTVDSPLGGLSRLQDSLIVDLWLGPCAAASDAESRFVDPTWPGSLAGRVADLQTAGLQFFAVANPHDVMLSVRTQQVPGSLANVIVDAVDSSVFNHAAVLQSAAGVAQIARLVFG